MLAGSYATIVGLISSFAAGRSAKSQLEFNEFLEWLIRHGHEEIRELIESNQATSASLKALLNEGRAELVRRLEAIEKSLHAVSQGQGAFQELADSLHPGSGPSDQAIDLLVAFEDLGASRVLEVRSMEGRVLIFMDGKQNSQYIPAEPRFFDSDIEQLLALRLLLLNHNASGGRIFVITRQAAQLAARMLKERGVRT